MSSRTGAASSQYLREIAEEVLEGVGDGMLGEWMEIGEIAVHLRRRLTTAEARSVGPVVDVRGSWEGQKRMTRMQKYLPRQWQGVEQ